MEQKDTNAFLEDTQQTIRKTWSQIDMLFAELLARIEETKNHLKKA